MVVKNTKILHEERKQKFRHGILVTFIPQRTTKIDILNVIFFIFIYVNP